MHHRPGPTTPLVLAGLALASACTRVDYSTCEFHERVVTDEQRVFGEVTVAGVLAALETDQGNGRWSADEAPATIDVTSVRAEGEAVYRTAEYGRTSIFSGLWSGHRDSVLYLDTASWADTALRGAPDCRPLLTIPLQQTLRTTDGALHIEAETTARVHFWDGIGDHGWEASTSGVLPLDAAIAMPPLEPPPAEGDPYLWFSTFHLADQSTGSVVRLISDWARSPSRAEWSEYVLWWE